MPTKFQEVADAVLAQTRCTVTWTETREGTAQRQARHVTAPHLDGPDPVEHFAILMHELGHIDGPTDFPLGVRCLKENAATTWALANIRKLEDDGRVPKGTYERAEYALAWRLGVSLRADLSQGKTTLDQISEWVAPSILRLVGPLVEPAYLCELPADALRGAMKGNDGRGFPATMSEAERRRMLDRLDQWVA